jgi:hypothetical protein
MTSTEGNFIFVSIWAKLDRSVGHKIVYLVSIPAEVILMTHW